MGRLGGATDAAAIGAAVRGYVEDRLGLVQGAVTASEATRRLREAGANGTVLEDVKALLVDCDQAVYAGSGVAGDLAERAQSCIGRLERERIR